MSLFPNKNKFMWTSSYEANDPSEDRYSSLVNMILQGDESENHFIRMSMWAVLDGHGGGAVANYASEVLLPHIAVNISQALQTRILSKGEYNVNGEVQDVEVIDFEDVLRGHHNKTSSIIDKYLNNRRKRQRTDLSKEDVAKLIRSTSTACGINYQSPELASPKKKFQDQELHRISDTDSDHDDSYMASKRQDFYLPRNLKGYSIPRTSSMAKVGTHSKTEVDAVRRAIHDSFLEFDDSWINSIDPEHVQKSCSHSEEWSVGSCALITCIIQRIDLKDNFNTFESNLNRFQCSPKKRKASPIEFIPDQANFHAHDAMLYTAHCGDCRAVLGVQRDSKDTPYNNAISDSESEDSCFSSSDEDSCSSDSFSDDDDLDNIDSSSRRSANFIVNSPGIRSSTSIYPRFRPGMLTGSAEYDHSTDSSASSYRKYKRNRFPSNLRSIDLTTDHNPYNPNEVELVLKRCRNDPKAISTSVKGGIKRVAGTLAITRALGDAYLKTPRFSFPPYNRYAPYITAMPEISNRLLTRSENGALLDRVLIMATDGLWGQANGHDVVQWVQTFFTDKRKFGAYYEENINRFQRFNNEMKYCSPSSPRTSSDYIIQCVLNRIVRSKKISSLQALMALNKGRARRSKHDDITASVVDLAGFVL